LIKQQHEILELAPRSTFLIRINSAGQHQKTMFFDHWIEV